MAKKFYKKNSKKGKNRIGQRPTISLKGNRRGMSSVVTAIILVALSMAAIVLVWAFVSNMVKKQISSSESCYGNYDKIKINGQYTCFERISAASYNLRFSLSIGDIDVDKVIVSVSSMGAVKSYTLTNTPQVISGLKMYPSGINQVNLSGKNAGLSYNATGFGGRIDSVQIAPVIGGNLCEVSDSIASIEDCKLIS